MKLMWLALSLSAGVIWPLSAPDMQAAAKAARAMQFAAAERGFALSQTCSQCHAIERGRRFSPNPEAPAFQTIADTPGMSALALRAFLYTPHRMMPNIVLTHEEADDVIDYILSLR